jgi:hypothetical protein
MATIYKFVRGDTSPQIRVTLTRESGEVVDLTDATVYLHVKPANSNSLTMSKQAIITDAEAGKFTIAWGQGDLDIDDGSYNAEIEVVASLYRETVYDLIQLQIRDDIA